MFPVIGHHDCSNLLSIVFDSGKNLHGYRFIIFFELILEIFFEYLLKVSWSMSEGQSGELHLMDKHLADWHLPVLGSAMRMLEDAIFSLQSGTQDFEESCLAWLSDPKSVWAVLHIANSVVLFISPRLLRPAFPGHLAVCSPARYELVPKLFL
jgi:hypothetical protein